LTVNSVPYRTTVLKRFVLYWFPLFCYLAFIFYISSLSFHIRYRPFQHFDKLLHMLEYAILSLFFYRALRDTVHESFARYVSVMAIGACIFYGILDEYHQSFVPFRTSDPLDVVADAVGATLMQWILHFSHR